MSTVYLFTEVIIFAFRSVLLILFKAAVCGRIISDSDMKHWQIFTGAGGYSQCCILIIDFICQVLILKTSKSGDILSNVTSPRLVYGCVSAGNHLNRFYFDKQKAGWKH